MLSLSNRTPVFFRSNSIFNPLGQFTVKDFRSYIHIERRIVLDRRLLNFSEITLSENRLLKVSNLIGKGGYNNIYKAEVLTPTDTKAVAVRMSKWPIVSEEEKHLLGDTYVEKQHKSTRMYMDRQLRILDFFEGENLKHIDCTLLENVLIESTDGISTIRPLYSGDLLNHLEKMSSFGDLLRVFTQVCYGLDGLHTKYHVSHNDLKPSNILIDCVGRAALSDLDHAEFMLEQWNGQATSGYYDTTWELREPLTSAFDVFSMGKTILSLLEKRKWNCPQEHIAKTEEVALRAIDPIRQNRPLAKELATRLHDIFLKVMRYTE